MKIKGVLTKIEKNGMSHQKDEWIGEKYEVEVREYSWIPGKVGFFRDVDQPAHADRGIRTSPLQAFNFNIADSKLEVKTKNSTYFFTVYEVA